ncbi:MAG: Eco57I restriction-modification methylase domain-containing protein [Nitrospirota bacterium]
MQIENHVQSFIPKTDSPEKIYDLFLSLGYPKDKLLDPSYKRKIEEFEFAKEEREKIKDIYTVFNYDGKLQIFLIEVTSLTVPLVRYLTKRLSDRYLRFLLILTPDYKEYTFVFPEFERIEEGKHKLKITRLNFNRAQTYHTDLLTISNIALTGDEENWRDIWMRWKDAFSVEKVTDKFFEDYKNAFFELRHTFENQKIPIKSAHELSQQFLNRLMFLYFISKKKWLNNDPKFIKWYWERYKAEKRNGTVKQDTFYEQWLEVLFLQAFNNQYSHPQYFPKDIHKILAEAPYLNGGLFKRNDLDELSFSIKDSLFEIILSFFEKYNFTIREEEPLDVEVAVDPQMIGYVYESLSNVAEEIYERQDLGIFYTPTVEVDFMCRRAMVEYLSNHLTELSKEWIYRLLFDEDKKTVMDQIIKQKLWYRLEEVLDNLAIVDPACGSGAFLVGMLHVLAELYRLIYSFISREMTEFELKKKVIGTSLYGVDVMPWAVHSAELRLWLQLIIEEDIPVEQRKLFPLLPNLNFKLRVGDSLVQEMGGISLHMRDSKLSADMKRKLSALKSEKEKYFNNDPSAKFKSDKALLQEELRIFGEILDDKIVTLRKDIQGLEGEKRKLQMEMFEELKKDKSKQTLLFEEEIKAKENQIELLRETKRKIQTPEQKPFVWDIDFAEIFGDKGGFDIVIGNPPYVRQEKIAPPNKLKAEITLEDKREYKDKLLSSIQVHYPFVRKLDKKSDYYIYFYFHGLSLLNEKGIFCFITSNSWLDVGYGKELQEFLLKYCHVKAIYDNEAKRSFEHADVNTIIALFGPPQISKGGNDWPALKEMTRFVMFKKPFEEAVNTKNLLTIEKADSIFKTESYRVYPVKQETLLKEGWEQPEEESQESEEKIAAPSARNDKVLSKILREERPASVIAKSKESDLSLRGVPQNAGRRSNLFSKEKFFTGKYEGNKWGGKYLRAPDIFFTILEKGKGKLVRLGDTAEVKYGIKTGANEFFYMDKESVKEWHIEDEFLAPVIKSPRECKGIRIGLADLKFKVFMCHKSKKDLKGTNALKYIVWGEKQGFHERPSCRGRRFWWECPDLRGNMFWVKETNDRLGVFLTENHMLCDCRLYFADGDVNLQNSVNSTVFGLISEILSRAGLGEGAKSLMVYEVNNLLTLDPALLKASNLLLEKRDLKSIFVESGINSARPIREQKPNPLPDRKALDDIVFDILSLTEAERNEVYWSVCELVKNRLEKARSV